MARKLGEVDGLDSDVVRMGPWVMDDDDFWLAALLQDSIYAAELLWPDPGNFDYGGCYRVRDYQYPFDRPESNYEGFACARSTGKALAHDALVLTPVGYVTMEDLRVGDLVIGSDGAPTPVIGVYPQGVRQMFLVDFTDGATVECDDEHLWTVTCDTWQSRGTGEKTMRLREMRQRKTRFKVRLPSAPVQFAAEQPEVDPWLIGAILGDGNTTRPTMIRFASVDEENIERVQAALPDDAELVCDGGCNYRVRCREWIPARPETGTSGRAAHRLLRWVREENLRHPAHEKLIPDDLLYGSVETRLALLRGLADTDGSVDRSGSVEICSASRALADGIRHLALSLGGRASIRTGPTVARDRHRVVFRLPDLNPFLLSRKAELYAARNKLRVRDCDWRLIERITPHVDKEAICIEVASADGLFMTNDMVLTHNTESIKRKTFTHAFRRHGENLLLTAPELIHLLPLTDAIEDRIRDTRLTREFLDSRGGKTGFTHRPFGVDFYDGTKIVGRIPRLTGTGVKGQHQPDLLIDESQDFPERGWIEVHETVMKDHVDVDGNPDFSYTFYGVHSGARDSGFHKRASEGAFRIVQITAMQRPGWGKPEKDAAKAAYGGTSSPDYRRNILGEAGSAASAFFVISRLVACMDQDRDSDYNTIEYRHQELRAEEVAELDLPILEVLDLPSSYGRVWGGMDVGLTNSPTVITLWAEVKDHKKRNRLKLFRRITLERFRTRMIREALYAIDNTYGNSLLGFGMDVTGLGFPMWQEMEDDEGLPPHLKEVARGYFFNAKVPVQVDKELISEDRGGRMRDQYGSAVKLEEDPLTGIMRYITEMTMIEASTRYLREWVDSTYLLLPFDTAISADFMGETQQRVKRTGELRKKPNMFHTLDSARAMAMVRRSDSIEAALMPDRQVPVFDQAF